MPFHSYAEPHCHLDVHTNVHDRIYVHTHAQLNLVSSVMLIPTCLPATGAMCLGSAYFNQDTWPQNGNMTAPNSWKLPCHIGVGGIVCRCGAHAATLLGPKWPQRHRLVVEGAQVSLNINSQTSNTFDQIQLSDMGHHCHLHSTIVNNSQHDIAYDITLLSLSLWYKKPQGWIYAENNMLFRFLRGGPIFRSFLFKHRTGPI